MKKNQKFTLKTVFHLKYSEKIMWITKLNTDYWRDAVLKNLKYRSLVKFNKISSCGHYEENLWKNSQPKFLSQWVVHGLNKNQKTVSILKVTSISR